MLALSTRRQHFPTAPSPPSSQHAYQQLPQQFAAQQLFDHKLLNDYLESQQQSYATAATSAPNSYMTSTYSDFANPAIRIQQSTPTPQNPQGFAQPSMLATNNSSSTGLESWNNYGNVQGQSLQTPSQHQSRGHQRASSSSSVGSSASQYQAVGPSTGYQYVAHSEESPLCSLSTANRQPRSFQNHLPTPTHTPTQDSFMNNSNNFNNYSQSSANMNDTMSAHMSMKQALMDQGDDVPDFAHSARQSVSSYGHDSPATPHTAQDEMDFKMPANGEPLRRIDSWLFDEFCTYTELDMRPVPKFERTYTDIAADTGFYEPSAASQPISQSKPAQSSLLSPYRSSGNENVQRALQAAQYARSQSPSSTASRSDSPFRKSSPYRQPSNTFNGSLNTAVAAREQNRQADAAYAMKTQLQATEESEPKTISPKDALLDYRENDDDSKVPLFPDSGANDYDGQYNGGDQYRTATQSSFDTPSSQSYRRDSWATPQFSPNFSNAPAPSLQPSSSFNFATPSLQGNMHGLQMNATSQYRPTPNNMSSAVDTTPEFPAHLTSMESSASEAEPPSGSQNSVLSDRYIGKPASTGAESGTYSCTYHGCSQRFETPQKLQKHKREGHRSANLSTAMTSAAILERNSQAGPHKCERINPTTGKPCNTVFSRPYDLTRHEDTIHNARKQKVRCALCVEEKTFSRNDALTRHMRVVHPEVDFPGKHRRRGSNHE
ncbi:c2h2 transcription factor [Pyrenophora seminiperda CCB06]|uniref:C2h2 transcription factor n=1 Tax=Pyrenophora seminiperda CCB06 TaxID=1302712 RepID=A0A3M7M474_9PLEO|nr:c2h2 transcription factor [Pyrenophora seminiperda CCB06]